MAFETFTGGRIVSKAPAVSILKQGNFNLNSSSTRMLKERGTDFVQLLYDKDSKQIAFKPCPKDATGAFSLRLLKGIGQVSGASFMKFYGIPFGGESRSYPAVWDDAQGLLIISLN